jgi:tripartite-type tricarboxylate transporter receptor subunit TctC
MSSWDHKLGIIVPSWNTVMEYEMQRMAGGTTDLIARAVGQKLSDESFASAGNGSLPHLAGEMFKSMTGTNTVHVPYKGGPQAMNDLLGGQVSLTFATAPQAVPHIRAGKLKVLGVSTAQRIHALPDVPTMNEAGLPGFEASSFHGLVAPAGLAPAIVDKIKAAVVRIVREAPMSKYLSDQGADPVTTTPAEYAAKIKEEVVTWAKVD